jgi:hypothetical protein
MSYAPVTLQRLDPDSEEYVDVHRLHAVQVNHKAGTETFDSAAGQYHVSLTFRFAWTKIIEQVRFAPQRYRLVFNGQTFAVAGYDDYMESHLYVVITGVAYG